MTKRKIKTICAWCGKLIQDGDDSKGISHGICPECAAKEIEKARKRGLIK